MVQIGTPRGATNNNNIMRLRIVWRKGRLGCPGTGRGVEGRLVHESVADLR